MVSLEKKYTRNDGNNAEGIGSILQSQLHLYAFCRMSNFEPLLLKLQNISHYQYIGETSDGYDQKINNFLSFLSETSKDGQYVDADWLIKKWGEQNNGEKKVFIQELFEKLNYDGPNYFNETKKTLSVHIRSLNKQDVCFNTNREYFNKDKEQYFMNLIQHIKEKHGDVDIHIFSQGQEETFKKFVEEFNCSLHIDDDVITTLYHLITSNFLITSNSSMSWVAHLFGQNNEVYSRENFFHSWYPGTFLTGPEGNIKKIKL